MLKACDIRMRQFHYFSTVYFKNISGEVRVLLLVCVCVCVCARARACLCLCVGQ
jgi:hypothetical protein